MFLNVNLKKMEMCNKVLLLLSISSLHYASLVISPVTTSLHILTEGAEIKLLPKHNKFDSFDRGVEFWKHRRTLYVDPNQSFILDASISHILSLHKPGYLIH